MPNMDPRALKMMMSKMGIKSTELEAEKVVIYCNDKEIVIKEPQITKIEMQGTVSFQIAGNVSENEIQQNVEISEEDIKFVMEKTGAERERAENAIKEANGDIAAAIINLTEQQ